MARGPNKLAAEARRLRGAGHGVDQIARLLGRDERTVYRYLDGDGVRPQKRRRDAGRDSKIMSPEAWEKLAYLTCIDGYSAEEALKIMEAHGLVARNEFDESWVNKRRRELGTTRKLLQRHGPRVSVKRERRAVNVEHQADATPAACIYRDASDDYWYEPHDPLKKTKQHLGKTPVHIFGLLEKHSRSIVLRSYDGETADNWLDFLYRAWSEKSDRATFPFCGLPRMVYCDGGSGLLAGTTTRALAQIGVKVIPHAPGEAWCKGGIERALQTWQTVCEPAMGHMKIGDEADLQVFLERASIYLNNRVHGETRQAPFVRWMEGVARRPDRLRLPPPREQWDRLCLREEECHLGPNMILHFGPSGHREKVELLDPRFLRYRGQKVIVYYAVDAEDPILVRLPPVSGFAGGEYRVERVRPGARPPSQRDSHMVTPGEDLLRRIRDLDTSDLDRTRHWEACVQQFPPVQAGERVTVDAAQMFRRRLSRLDVVNAGWQEGVLSTPLSPGDKAYIEELFQEHGETDGTVDGDTADAWIAELRRVKTGDA